MAKNKNRIITNLIWSFTASVFGVSFDAFWHLSMGRESFFVLPHLFVYGGTFAALFYSFKAYMSDKSERWKWILIILWLIPIAAIFDEIWHRIAGKENISSVMMLWSPPHIMLFLSAMISIMTFTLLIKSENYKHKAIAGPLLLGQFLTLLHIFLGPFSSTGPHHVLGVTGIGIIACAVIFTYYLSAKLFSTGFSATLTASMLTLLLALVYDANFYIKASDNFFHTPIWLLVIIYIIPAIAVDYFQTKHKMILGMVLGAFHAGAFYILASTLTPNSWFTYGELWWGVIFAALGGIFAGLAHEFIDIKNETPE